MARPKDYHNRIITLRGKKFRLKRRKRMPNDMDGDCTDPSLPEKDREIRIRYELEGKRELIILLHEMSHGCQWDISEDSIEEIAESMGEALWKIGYRRVGDQPKE